MLHHVGLGDAVRDRGSGGEGDDPGDRGGETAWTTLVAFALVGLLLTAIVVLAVQHYSDLFGVPPGDRAAWALPGSHGVVAVAGIGWGLILKARRPGIYATIGLGAHAVTGRPAVLDEAADVARRAR